MAGSKLRAIIFDIGRVLIRVDIARAMQGLASGSSLSPSEIWSAIEKDPRWPDWQQGRMAPADWCVHLCKRLGQRLTLAQFTEIWNRALDPAPIHEDAFFEKLSRRYRLAVLSNTDPIHVRQMEQSYSFFAYFPTRIYSCTAGASKPNPIVYQAALKGVKVQAAEALYVDDVGAYVQAAQQLGMAAIQFVTSEQLKQDLGSLGVNFA